MKNKEKWLAPVLACAIIFALMAYVGGYFWLSTPEPGFFGGTGGNDRTKPNLQRRYDTWWMAELFRPASEIEAFVTGVPTWTTSSD